MFEDLIKSLLIKTSKNKINAYRMYNRCQNKIHMRLWRKPRFRKRNNKKATKRKSLIGFIQYLLKSSGCKINVKMSSKKCIEDGFPMQIWFSAALMRPEGTKICTWSDFSVRYCYFAKDFRFILSFGFLSWTFVA